MIQQLAKSELANDELRFQTTAYLGAVSYSLAAFTKLGNKGAELSLARDRNRQSNGPFTDAQVVS
jgi:hypothetical protein